MQHALELHALLITQAARPVGEQTLDRAVLRVAADRVEAVRLDLVEERLVSCILHRAGRAAGEQQACVLSQRLAALPVQIVVVGKVGNRLHRLLRVHEGRADVGRNVVDLVRRYREALVLLNHDLQFVADLARILCLCVLAGCLCAAAVQTEQVQRLGICEDLAQRTQLVRRVGVAGQRKRTLLELAVLDGHDLVLRSPVERQRESRRAAVAQSRRRTRRRHKVDVRTGQNLVLYGVHTAA